MRSLCVLALLLLLPLTATAQQPFQTGVNQAWLGSAYGHDLTSAFDEAGWARVFERAARFEARIVRVWIFEDMEGLRVDAQGFPVGVDPRLLDNLSRLGQLARDAHVRVYWTLHDGNRVKLHTAEQLRRLLTDEGGWGQAFRERALAPVLEVLARDADVAWGLDLLNETQGAIRTTHLDGERLPGVWPDGWSGARRYLAKTAAFVHAHAPGLPVTASSGHSSGPCDLLKGRYDGLGLDFYDVHVYSGGRIPWAKRLASHARARGLPLVLGEFGPRKGLVSKILRGLSARAYARYQARTTRSFLAQAARHGFAAAFPWRLEDSDTAFTLFDEGVPRPALDELKKYAPRTGIAGGLSR